MRKIISGRDFEMIAAGSIISVCALMMLLMIAAAVKFPVEWEALSAIGTVLAIVVAIFLPMFERYLDAQGKRRESMRIVQTFIGRLDDALRSSYMWVVGDFTENAEADTADEIRITGVIGAPHRSAYVEALEKHLHFDDETGEKLVLTIESIFRFERRCAEISEQVKAAESERRRNELFKRFELLRIKTSFEIEGLGYALISYGASKTTWTPVSAEDL